MYYRAECTSVWTPARADHLEVALHRHDVAVGEREALDGALRRLEHALLARAAQTHLEGTVCLLISVLSVTPFLEEPHLYIDRHSVHISCQLLPVFSLAVTVLGKCMHMDCQPAYVTWLPPWLCHDVFL